MLIGWRWTNSFLDRLNCRIEVSSPILKSYTSSNSPNFRLLRTRLFILSIRFLESQNMALFKMRLLSKTVGALLLGWSSWEPRRKLRWWGRSWGEVYYFFFLKASAIFKITTLFILFPHTSLLVFFIIKLLIKSLLWLVILVTTFNHVVGTLLKIRSTIPTQPAIADITLSCLDQKSKKKTHQKASLVKTKTPASPRKKRKGETKKAREKTETKNGKTIRGNKTSTQGRKRRRTDEKTSRGLCR